MSIYMTHGEFKNIKMKLTDKNEYDSGRSLMQGTINNLKKKLSDIETCIKEMEHGIRKNRDQLDLTAGQSEMNDILMKINDTVS